MILNPKRSENRPIPCLSFRLRHLGFLFGIVLLTVSCGYSLEFKRIDDTAEDPITVVRRELRQLKADHRVALFDLQKEQKKQIDAMRTTLARVGQGNETLGKTLIQMKRDLSDTRMRLGQNNADTDERFAEAEIQHRLIHGRIEEEGNRFKESAARGNNFTVRELEGFRKNLSAQAKDFAAQKESFSQFKKNQTQAHQALKEQIRGVEAKSASVSQITDAQTKTLKSVSTQLTELIDKMLPAVNGLAARVDTLEWELKELKTNVDIEGLQKRLSEMTEAVDIQRQSLEMLGNTLAAQVDKQGAILKKVVKGLKGLQSKTSAIPESK